MICIKLEKFEFNKFLSMPIIQFQTNLIYNDEQKSVIYSLLLESCAFQVFNSKWNEQFKSNQC